MRLRLKTADFGRGGYSTGASRDVLARAPGDEFDVPDEVGARILAWHPEQFVAVDPLPSAGDATGTGGGSLPLDPVAGSPSAGGSLLDPEFDTLKTLDERLAPWPKQLEQIKAKGLTSPEAVITAGRDWLIRNVSNCGPVTASKILDALA